MGPLRRLDETADVAVRVLHGRDQRTATDILDLLLHLGTSVEEHLQALLNVVGTPVGNGPRHPLTVATGIQADILASDIEGDRTWPSRFASREDGSDPEHEALLADSVGLALLVVHDTLAPAERLAFVLHDMFAVPFGEIAPIVGRSAAAARQLASRACRRVRGVATVPDADLVRQRAVLDTFLAASRGGDFEALLALRSWTSC